MSYHPLANDSGSDADNRMAEARRLLEMLKDHCESMTGVEAKFFESMKNRTSCSVKQIFWLRDIKEKYL